METILAIIVVILSVLFIIWGIRDIWKDKDPFGVLMILVGITCLSIGFFIDI